MCSQISSATAPATAAIGVMNRSAANGRTAEAIRLATGPRRSRSPRLQRPSQRRQLLDQLVEQRLEPFPRQAVGGRDIGRLAPRLDDQIDGAVLQVQARPVGRRRGNGTAHRRRTSGRASTSSMETIASMWPPSAS